jgi:hypothetical protein
VSGIGDQDCLGRFRLPMSLYTRPCDADWWPQHWRAPHRHLSSFRMEAVGAGQTKIPLPRGFHSDRSSWAKRQSKMAPGSHSRSHPSPGLLNLVWTTERDLDGCRYRATFTYPQLRAPFQNATRGKDAEYIVHQTRLRRKLFPCHARTTPLLGCPCCYQQSQSISRGNSEHKVRAREPLRHCHSYVKHEFLGMLPESLQ